MVSLIAVQGYWLHSTYQLNKRNLNEKAEGVLLKVIEGMEKRLFSFSLYSRTYMEKGDAIALLKQNSPDGRVDSMSMFNAFPYPDRPDTCFYSTKDAAFDRPVVADVSLRFMYLPVTASSKLGRENERMRDMTQANYQSVLRPNESLLEAVCNSDSIIGSVLMTSGYRGGFVFGIRDTREHSFIFCSDKSKLESLAQTGHHHRLDMLSNIGREYELFLLIEEEEQLMRQSLIVPSVVACSIIAALAIVFYRFFSIVIRQKRLSEMKTDFMNNMTHEFLTPVTNISLAIETLERRDHHSTVQVEDMLTLIAHENAHLKDNINRVLTVASCEGADGLKHDVRLLNLHDVLVKLVKVLELPLSSKSAILRLELRAEQKEIYFDETDLSNLLNNILDNAIKYASPVRTPEISITSYNLNESIVLSISDNGIGMPKGSTRYIFDKFFRVHKGDRHDVKGFGLGLSHVQNIANAYGLKLTVDSQEDIGTTFTIFFLNQV